MQGSDMSRSTSKPRRSHRDSRKSERRRTRRQKKLAARAEANTTAVAAAVAAAAAAGLSPRASHARPARGNQSVHRRSIDVNLDAQLAATDSQANSGHSPSVRTAGHTPLRRQKVATSPSVFV